jgi:exonuclease VII small subunit
MNTCVAYLRYEVKYSKLEVEKRHRLNDDALYPEWHFDKLPMDSLVKYIEKCEKALERAEKRIADAMKKKDDELRHAQATMRRVAEENRQTRLNASQPVPV